MPDRGAVSMRSPREAILARLPRHDRGQLERGLTACLKAAYMQRQFGPLDTPLEQRAAEYARLTIEQRYAGFRKAYAPPTSTRRAHKNEFELVKPFVTTPAIKGKYGFPLGKFPATKHVHKRTVDPNEVEYSADEMDLDWMATINAIRHKLGKRIFSLAIFEFWVDRLEKKCLFTPKEHAKLRDEDGEELDDVCNVCLDGDTSNSNQIVYCDMCNLAIHQDCYGIPFLPEGSLVCRRCAVSPGKLVRCELCPSQTGAFKQLPNGKWVHVLCVIWVDETHFGNTIFMEHVQNVEKAIHDRRALSCLLCKSRVEARRGACIQCSETKCTASFHVTCARNAGLVMRVSETDDGHVSRWIWCMKHTPPETEADREQKQLMIRNARRENERKLPALSMPTITRAKIAEIVAVQPMEDYKEIVLFWFQKRKNRLGAPLLKKISDPNEKSESVTRRRLSRNAADVQMNGDMLRKRQKTLQHESAVSLADLVERREIHKKSYMNASNRLFVLAFKPAEVLQIEVIDAIKKKDEQNIFAEPVDIPGYREEIKKPMCLKTMTEKATHGKYGSIRDLAADVTLMLDNCAQFNRGNKWFIDYGKKIRRQSIPIIEAASAEEESRKGLRTDEPFMLRLVNSSMSEYGGWANKGSSSNSSSSSVVKIEEMDDDASDPPAGETPKRPRSKRRGGDEKEDKSKKRAAGDSDVVHAAGTPKQTKLIGFFCAMPKDQRALTFSSVPNAAPRPLFDTPSASKSTRSSSRLTTRREFRTSSAALQSPLPTTTKRRVGSDDDDEDDEIVILPPHQQQRLDAKQLEAQRLRCAENEAHSKFAHNQLVIVDGRAAKVIESQLAHLSDIHHEQRHSMMKKRREILGEITEKSLIYVEFFQKSANLENFKWVMPEAVELLDLNNVQRSPKVPGLKAAREWHQKVLDGDDV